MHEVNNLNTFVFNIMNVLFQERSINYQIAYAVLFASGCWHTAGL